MNEQLELLVRLQAIDHAVQKLNASRTNLESEIKKMRDGFTREAEDFNRLNQELEESKKNLRSEERTLQQVGDNLAHYEKKIYSVKSQKEMEAVDHEIKAAREEKGKLEESILYLFEAVDKLSAKVKAEEEILSQARVKLEKGEKNYKKQLAQINKSLKSDKVERENIMGSVRPDTLSLYEKLRINRNNLAVTSILGGACGGCFMTLPPQVVNEVKPNSSIIRCQSCTRILYWDGKEE